MKISFLGLSKYASFSPYGVYLRGAYSVLHTTFHSIKEYTGGERATILTFLPAKHLVTCV